MNYSRLRALSLSLVFLVATAVYAVEQLPEKEEDIPVEFIPRLDNTVSIGLHRTASGPKVKFGNLGVISLPKYSGTTRVYSNGSVSEDSESAYERNATGAVDTSSQFTNYAGVTSVRSADGGGLITVYDRVQSYTTTQVPLYDTDGVTPLKNDDGTPKTVPNYALDFVGTTTTPVYQKNADGTDLLATVGKLLAYQPGRTRSWTVNDSGQFNLTDPARPTVAMTTYGVESQGGSAEAKGSSSTGFELTLERKLGQRGRFEWGFSGGFNLTSINAKVSGTVISTAISVTDIYDLVNTGLNAGLLNGGLDNNTPGRTLGITQPSGNASDLNLLPLVPVMVDGKPVPATRFVDTTTPPSSVTFSADQSLTTPISTIFRQGNEGIITIIQDVAIEGQWQLKGAYYLTQFGPTFRYRFNDRWAVSGGAGLAVGYIGTVFRANEQVVDFVNGKDLGLHISEENNTHKFIPGYYGNINFEYWITERTGFYLGANYQKMGSYTQIPMSTRTAKIDLGGSSGWRFGIMTRF